MGVYADYLIASRVETLYVSYLKFIRMVITWNYSIDICLYHLSSCGGNHLML